MLRFILRIAFKDLKMEKKNLSNELCGNVFAEVFTFFHISFVILFYEVAEVTTAEHLLKLYK